MEQGKLGRQQELAIAALLTEKTVAAAAGKAGCSERTLLRWLGEPEFHRAFLAARRQVLDATVGRLQQASVAAVDTLARNLACGVPAVEVRAAVAILELSAKALELSDLAERLEVMEQRLAETQRTNGKARQWAH